MSYYSIYNKTLDELYYAEDKEIAIKFVNDVSRKHNKFIIKKVPDHLVTGNTLNYIENNMIAYSTENSRILTSEEYEGLVHLDDYITSLGKSLDDSFEVMYYLKDNDFIMDTLTSLMDILCDLTQICLYETIFEFGGDLSIYLNVEVLTDFLIRNNSGRRK